MLIDTHAHLTFPEFSGDLPAVIQRAKESGIANIINIALDNAALGQSLQLSAAYPGYIYSAFGLHPQEAKNWDISIEKKVRELAGNKKIIAIGETGLDYFYKHSPVETQQAVFRKFLGLAQELDLPAIVHSRDASKDTIRILREENQGKLRGVLHCFGGDMELAAAALEMGMRISFTANITFPKAEKIRSAAREIPLERIMLETDCPFLAPQIFRGKRNEPSYVVEVAKQIADVKSIPAEKVADQTSWNAQSFFSMV